MWVMQSHGRTSRPNRPVRHNAIPPSRFIFDPFHKRGDDMERLQNPLPEQVACFREP